MISFGVTMASEIALFSFLDLSGVFCNRFEDNLVPMVDYACRGLSSLPGYHTRSPLDGKFRGFAGNLDGLMATCRFFGEVGDLLSLPIDTSAAAKRRKSKTSTTRGYRKSPISISSLIIYQQNVFGCDGASKGCQRARNLVPQSKNRGQIFENWNYYVRLLGERPYCLSSLFKLCVGGSSDGEFCGILAKTGPFRVALVFRGGW